MTGSAVMIRKPLIKMSEVRIRIRLDGELKEPMAADVAQQPVMLFYDCDRCWPAD